MSDFCWAAILDVMAMAAWTLVAILVVAFMWVIVTRRQPIEAALGAAMVAMIVVIVGVAYFGWSL
jgi:hypothetical protein